MKFFFTPGKILTSSEIDYHNEDVPGMARGKGEGRPISIFLERPQDTI